MGAADFRAGRRCLMHSAKPLGLILPRGSPRFLDMSLAARCPQSPRTTPPLHALVASGRATGFAISGRLAVVDSVTRPNRVRLRCGSPLCSPRLRPDGLLRWPLGPLYVERAINIVELSSTRHARLRPGAPEGTEKESPSCRLVVIWWSRATTPTTIGRPPDDALEELSCSAFSTSRMEQPNESGFQSGPSPCSVLSLRFENASAQDDVPHKN
jgi:hypothetical protein